MTQPICNISLEPPSNPVRPFCGHLFELSYLVSALLHDRRCPVCRTVIDISSIRVDYNIQPAPATYVPPAPAVTTSLLYTSNRWGYIVAEIRWRRHMRNLQTDPCVYMFSGDDALFVDYENPFDPPAQPLPWPRSINLNIFTVNPASSMLDRLRLPPVPDHNRSFQLGRSTIHRYAFQHRGEYDGAIERLVRRGLYIYDLFRISPSTYVLYSTSQDIRGAPHFMPLFKRNNK